VTPSHIIGGVLVGREFSTIEGHWQQRPAGAAIFFAAAVETPPPPRSIVRFHFGAGRPKVPSAKQNIGLVLTTVSAHAEMFHESTQAFAGDENVGCAPAPIEQGRCG
jgi:hypothetical protein